MVVKEKSEMEGTTLTKFVQAVHLRHDGRELVGIGLRHLIPLICAHTNATYTTPQDETTNQTQSGNQALEGGKALPLMRFFTARYRARSLRRSATPCVPAPPSPSPSPAAADIGNEPPSPSPPNPSPILRRWAEWGREAKGREGNPAARIRARG
jgi:hypothetical protein